MEVETAVKKRRSIWCSRPTILPVNSVKLPKWDLDIVIRSKIDDLEEVWNNNTPDESFAGSRYLRTLELTNQPNLKNLYVVLKKQDREIGVILMQSLILKLSDSFDYDNYTTNRSFFSRVWQKIRQIGVSLITFRMITIGNLYLTGQYGIHFKENTYNKEDQFKIINDLMKVLYNELCGTEYRFNGILYKDFFDEDTPDQPNELSLYPFQIDPNMILSIRSSWMTFDDYLLDMKSKYRVRLKNAMKKFKGIERRSLSHEEVLSYNDRMYQLYKNILDGSGFVLAMGQKEYFSALKNQFKEDLNVIGYFLEGELIGFYTWVLEGDKMDSHFIGFEPSLNNRYQIYLNILLDLVRDSIEQKARKLYYFRTALEIKSSVGSEPHDMTVYFKHTNWFFNKFLIPTAFKYFVPQQNWKQRHPFK